MNIIVEESVAEQFKKELPFVHVLKSKLDREWKKKETDFFFKKKKKEEDTNTIDFAITLGGDGTLLHLSTLFPKAVPPVLSFSLGTLCFLMSYSK